MSLMEIAKDIHFTSASKGFEAPALSNIDQKLLLAVSEICEAQNELRDGRGATEVYYNGDKPEGFPIELADAIIRLLDVGYSLGIDLDTVVSEKIAFNKTRPPKHGRLF